MADNQDNSISSKTTETAARLLEIVRALSAELHPGQKEASKAVLDSSLDRDLGFDSLGISFAARARRLEVSGNPSQYDDLELFVSG